MQTRRVDGQMNPELVTYASLKITQDVKYGRAAGRRRAHSPQDPAPGILCNYYNRSATPAPTSELHQLLVFRQQLRYLALYTRADPQGPSLEISPAACMAFQETRDPQYR